MEAQWRLGPGDTSPVAQWTGSANAMAIAVEISFPIETHSRPVVISGGGTPATGLTHKEGHAQVIAYGGGDLATPAHKQALSGALVTLGGGSVGSIGYRWDPNLRYDVPMLTLSGPGVLTYSQLLTGQGEFPIVTCRLGLWRSPGDRAQDSEDFTGRCASSTGSRGAAASSSGSRPVPG